MFALFVATSFTQLSHMKWVLTVAKEKKCTKRIVVNGISSIIMINLLVLRKNLHAEIQKCSHGDTLKPRNKIGLIKF